MMNYVVGHLKMYLILKPIRMLYRNCPEDAASTVPVIGLESKYRTPNCPLPGSSV